MTVSAAEFDAMPVPQAADLLSACCGAQRWVSGVVARRPFGSREVLLEAADLVWRSLTPSDWLEAFSHHPRIGERKSEIPQPELGQRWSAGEQREVDDASPGVREALSRVNQEYESRFGYLYIVDASGKSAEELLTIARARLTNDPESERLIAAGEQHKILRRRLETLFR